ncbi:MAG: hypothetical protein J0M24_00515 [Verrucomicrobia bacterium]|nr:hypothetical protein [Verrucomicrobiota bacterium]
MTASAHFRLATPDDDDAIRRLLRDNPMPGAVTLSFEREPDYFRSAGLAGADDQTILAFADQRLVCVGRCTVRPGWINGAIRRLGYLGELRLDATAHGRFHVVRGGYQFFRELHRANPADFYFTSIATDNDRARRLLERGVRGLPRYDPLGGLMSLLVPVPQNPQPPAVPLETAHNGDLEELAALLNQSAQRHQLATAWTAHQLASLGQHGLPPERFRLLRRHGRIVACAALWDQRGFRQIRVRGYSGLLGWARPAWNLAARLFGTPRLPAPKSVLANAFVSPLASAEADESLVPDLVAGLFPEAVEQGLEFLTLGLGEGDPQIAALRRRFPCRTYMSRIYRVSWDEDPDPIGALDGRLFRPDISLL